MGVMNARPPRVLLLPRPRWRVVLGGVVAGLGAIWLGYVVESVRGRHEWAKVARQAEAAGVSLRLEDLLPAARPEAENFAAVLAPVWVGEAAAPWGLVRADDPLVAPDFGMWWKGEPVPLDAWRSYLGTQDLIGWIDARHAADLTVLARAASERPGAYFAVDHERGVFAGMAFVPPLQSLTRLFTLRAVARLERADAAGALADVIAALRLANMVRDEPFLLTQLSSNAQAQWALQAVRAGLARRAWTEPELARLDEALARFDQVGNGMRALRGDLAFATELMRGLADESRETVAAVTGGAHGPDFVHRVPSGWVYQNMARLGRVYLDEIFPAYDERARRIDLTRLEAAERGVAAMKTGPYTILTRMFMTPVHNAIRHCAATQTQVDMARVACALEAHRLRTGAYPEALGELPPVLAGLTDWVTGEPPRYRRDAAGGFLLYTTGANARDDGGELVLTPFGDLSALAGDWVWPTPTR